MGRVGAGVIARNSRSRDNCWPHFYYAGSAENVNFDVKVMKLIIEHNKKHKFDLYDADMYGESSEFRPWNMPAVTFHPAEALVQVHRARSLYRKPLKVIDEWFYNEQESSPLSVTFIHKTSCTAEVQSRTLNMVRTGLSGSVEASIPKILSGASSFKMIFDTKTDSSKTVTTEETLTVKEVLTVSPQTATHVTWFISEDQVEIPWMAEVLVTGYIITKFRRKDTPHTQFVGVGEIPGATFLTPVNRSTARMMIDGTFIVTRGMSGETVAQDYPLKQGVPDPGQQPDVFHPYRKRK
ncbi:uncharacterized protein LOC144167669 isoform X1 [Haemaphysalis longicornis]